LSGATGQATAAHRRAQQVNIFILLTFQLK